MAFWLKVAVTSVNSERVQHNKKENSAVRCGAYSTAEHLHAVKCVHLFYFLFSFTFLCFLLLFSKLYESGVVNCCETSLCRAHNRGYMFVQGQH